MDKIWAPWRINYIKNIEKKGCLFCLIKKTAPGKKAKQDKKNLIIYRSKKCFAVLNLFPYNNGHLMIAPYRHIRNLSSLRDDEILDLIRTTAFMKKALHKTLNPGGYNVGINIGKIAGAGIAGHLHIHIVPRWQGDTNFMPVISHTKIISQSLKELYDILHQEISKNLKKQNKR